MEARITNMVKVTLRVNLSISFSLKKYPMKKVAITFESAFAPITRIPSKSNVKPQKNAVIIPGI